MKKLLIVTDAWFPQINGVVRTLNTTIEEIQKRGDMEVLVIEPGLFSHFSLPGYKEISISYNIGKGFDNIINQYKPDYIHISVEGTLGMYARKYCIEHGLAFTTAYHTKFPEFVEERLKIVPAKWIYPMECWFHNKSSRVMVATETLKNELIRNGFNTKFGIWGRGVDINLFKPVEKPSLDYVLYVGRVSHEKNIEAFLNAETKLPKLVIGDGPQINSLRRKYKDVRFPGSLKGDILSKTYANAAAFVFPSKVDTFGLVMLEALACGTPVAAFNVSSPCDIITKDVGSLNDDLSVAIEESLSKDRNMCREFVINNYTWEVATNQFLSNLEPV